MRFAFSFLGGRTSRALSLVVLLALSCSGEAKRKPIASGGGSGSGSGAGSGSGDDCEKPGVPDTGRLCGNEVVPVTLGRPNVYFILDTSGSMAEPLSNGTSRLRAAKTALISVAENLGHRIRYGLATYPGKDAQNEYGGCAPGDEIFPLTDGDPIECLNDPGGEVLDSFRATLASVSAEAGTPLSATLAQVVPNLLELDEKTVVLLLTDGAPNCNPSAACGVDRCSLNIEGYVANDLPCSGQFNCCDPANADQTLLSSPPSSCVDEDGSIAGLHKLADAGIHTYVIGIPGADAYDDVMNSLAEAGGVPRSGVTKYYDPKDEDEILETLTKLGVEVTTDCAIELGEKPRYPNMVNVYLDETLVKKDEEDGFTLEDKTVTLHGEACEKLKSGEVTQVQVVTGCETIVK